MAIRRINYTGRKKLNREDVSISLNEKQGETTTFDASLSKLKDYTLPDSAYVFVEARLQTRWMRFEFGTIGALVAPPDRRLIEFDSTDGVLFSVKVTATTDKAGKLLAAVDRVPVRFPGEVEERRTSLLPVQLADIGELIWRLDFSATGTLLQINNRVGDKDALALSPLFRSLVYPAVFREILNRIILIEEIDEVEYGGEGWESRWLRFAVSLPGVVAEPAKADDKDQWIEDAVLAFAKQQSTFDRFIGVWPKGGA